MQESIDKEQTHLLFQTNKINPNTSISTQNTDEINHNSNFSNQIQFNIKTYIFPTINFLEKLFLKRACKPRLQNPPKIGPKCSNNGHLMPRHAVIFRKDGFVWVCLGCRRDLKLGFGFG